MKSHGNKTLTDRNGVWIISGGTVTDSNLPQVEAGTLTGPAKEYQISDLARYLLSPNPVCIHKRLVGCKVYFPRSRISGIKEGLRKMLPPKMRCLLAETHDQPEVFISHTQKRMPVLKDPNLELHFKRIEDLLRPYDSSIKRLLQLDTSRVSDVMGISVDLDGSRSVLKLKGSMDEKIEYIIGNLSSEVGVVLNTSQISDGLFEMSGFDFRSYNSDKSYRLLKFAQSETPKCCILDRNNKILYWTENTKLVHYLQLLEQSIRTNPKFRDSLKQCIEGDAMPLKLLFNHELQVEYSTHHPPETFKQVFEAYPMEATWKTVVMDSLRDLQLGISFNYLLRSDSGQEKLCTNISVMHNIRALDSIKDIVPQVYAEIKKRACASEAGRFYLLDTVRGYPNEK